MSEILKPGTPLPWKVATDGAWVESDTPARMVVCDSPNTLQEDPDVDWDDNAAYIVTACNAYPCLVSVVRDLVHCMANEPDGFHPMFQQAARNALAKAGVTR